MKAHTWIKEELDCGPLGRNTFWRCTKCNAAGGSADLSPDVPEWKPFYADGSQLKLSDDCDEAKAQIKAHLRTAKGRALVRRNKKIEKMRTKKC